MPCRPLGPSGPGWPGGPGGPARIHRSPFGSTFEHNPNILYFGDNPLEWSDWHISLQAATGYYDQYLVPNDISPLQENQEKNFKDKIPSTPGGPGGLICSSGIPSGPPSPTVPSLPGGPWTNNYDQSCSLCFSLAIAPSSSYVISYLAKEYGNNQEFEFIVSYVSRS